MSNTLIGWLVLILVGGVALAIDLRIGGERVSPRSALIASAVWTAVGLAFAVVPLLLFGAAPAGRYLTVYLLEKSLSIDNVAIFTAVLAGLALSPRRQNTALTGGILAALVLRIGFVVAGLAVIDAVHDALIAFGVLLVASGIRMAWQGEAQEEEPRIAARLRRSRISPMAAAVVALGATDLLMALDSVPAAFAITRVPYLVLAPTALALLGLRPLYHLLSAGLSRFRFLGRAVGVLLVVTGVALCAEPFVKVPEWALLAAVVGCIGGGVAFSVVPPRRLLVAVGGGLLLLAGAAMLVLPGPGLVVIALGLALFAREFRWARRLLDKVVRRLPERWQRRVRRWWAQPPEPTGSGHGRG